MKPRPNPAQAREQTRQAEEISARHDSPNGGLKALREKNAREIELRNAARERRKVTA